MNISEKKRAEQMVVDAFAKKSPHYPEKTLPTEPSKDFIKQWEKVKEAERTLKEEQRKLEALPEGKNWRFSGYEKWRFVGSYNDPKHAQAVEQWQKDNKRLADEREAVVAQVWNDDFTFATLADYLGLPTEE